MKWSVPVPRWDLVCVAFAAVLVFALVGPRPLAAQETGTVRGQVIATNSGEQLPGAQVMLQGTNYGAVTDRNGRYRIEKVPPGRYTLVVSYLGFDPYTREITVPAGGVVTETADLRASYVRAEGIQVRMLQQGQAKALTRQKNSNTIVNVVDEEQIESFPDLNAADAIQRVPGVNISRSFGEGKFVFLRGTEPRLTSVTVNGEKIATPEDAERFVALDVISASQLSEMRVTKALTPDMDGDAIGGVVDLVTQSPFDRGDRRIRFTGGGGYSDLGDQPLYQATFSFSDVWNDRIGFSFNANYNRIERITHNNEMDWDDIDLPDDTEMEFGFADMELRRYVNERDRYGLNADLEFRPDETSSYYVRGMFNMRDDHQNRNQYRFRVDRGDYITPTQTEGSRLVRGLQDRVESQIISSVSGGGEHVLETWNVDYRLTYTYGEQDKDGQIIPEFQMRGLDMELDLRDPDEPGITITNMDPSQYLDPANYELDLIDFRNEFTSDKETIATLNLETPYTLGDVPASFKFGAKGRFKSKDRSDERWRYRWEGEGDITMDMFASDDIDEEFFDGAYRWGPTIDVDAIRSFLDEHRGTPNLEEEVRYDDAVGDAYDASEDILAGYAMTTFNLGDVTLIGGVRYEHTGTDYSGTRLSYDEDGEFVDAQPVSDDRTYSHVFPALHLKWSVRPETIVRLAYTTGIARPNFFDLVPYFWVFPEDEEILRGNSELDPTFSNNFDLMAEHYFQGIGILSGGVFYKKLDDIIYVRNFVEEGGAFDGFDVEQPINGGSADLFGVELNWNQQFTFLPGFWSGFGIYGNYTYTESEADLLFRDWTTLPGQASDSGNLALTYSGSRLNARISMNFNGEYIDEVGKNPEYDEIISDHTQWDFSSSYRITPAAEIYFNVVNINDSKRLDYIGRRSRPIQRERYSWWSTFGMKFTLN